jgi:hypothetical protein
MKKELEASGRERVAALMLNAEGLDSPCRTCVSGFATEFPVPGRTYANEYQGCTWVRLD